MIIMIIIILVVGNDGWPPELGSPLRGCMHLVREWSCKFSNAGVVLLAIEKVLSRTPVVGCEVPFLSETFLDSMFPLGAYENPDEGCAIRRFCTGRLGIYHIGLTG